MASEKAQNVQEVFLNNIRKNKTAVTLKHILSSTRRTISTC